MIGSPKIRLSPEEQSVLANRKFFEIKRLITDKLYHQFANIIAASKNQALFKSSILPPGTDAVAGKISKGENYLGLPYLMLDFPRNFSPDHMLAVRTMIWWGNFFSCTLLASGKEVASVKQAILNKKSLLARHDFSICINTSPWHHHFESDNYRPVKELAKSELLRVLNAQDFVKIARKRSLTSINNLEIFVLESYAIYDLLLTARLRYR